MVRTTCRQDSDYKYMWKFDTSNSGLLVVNLDKVLGGPDYYMATFIDEETENFFSERPHFSDDVPYDKFGGQYNAGEYSGGDYVIKDDGKNDVKGFLMHTFTDKDSRIEEFLVHAFVLTNNPTPDFAEEGFLTELENAYKRSRKTA